MALKLSARTKSSPMRHVYSSFLVIRLFPPLLPPMLLGIGGIGRIVTLSPFFKHTTYATVWLVTRTSSLFEPTGGFTLPILTVVCTIQKVFNT